MRGISLAVATCIVWPLMAAPAESTSRPTIRTRSCLGWDAHLKQMLHWSETFSIHDAMLRYSVRSEAEKLRRQCARDITLATSNRYVLLTKLLFDDEADEIESFD